MIVLVVILAVLVGVLGGLCLALWFPLSDYSRWYREDHKATPMVERPPEPRPDGPNPMIPDTRKATRAENERMKHW